ncbi:MAG: response regulator [Magnetococcus sp. MYC-9]
MPLNPQAHAILIVDDEPVNIEVLNEILQDDYRILFATHGEEALEVASAQRPDLILLDVMMPGMDGREVCARIKADPDLRDIPVIFVTAMARDQHEMTGLEAGAVDYITKPVSPAVVQLRVRNHLELKQHRERLETLIRERTAELVQARDSAKEREALLWTVLSSSLDAFIMMDVQGKVLEFNPAAETLFGFNRAQLIGEDLAEFIIPSELRRPYRQALVRARMRVDGAPLFVSRRITTDGLRADGKIVDLEVTISTVVAHGQPVYAAFLRDITSATQLRRSLGAALDTAEAAFRAKDLFLANMSHELRTPMNGVLGMIDLALGCDSPDKAREFLSHAKSSSRLLLRVINDILDYSKIESGKLLMESVDFCLEELLADVIQLFRQTAIDKELELVVSAPSQSLGLLVGDRLRLQQVLVNLLGNAVKFTQTGGIHVKTALIEQTEERVRLQFSIQDTGIGIDAEQLSLLFSPFVQADSSITRKYGGTGLGLTICKRLVEMMGGEIWIDSAAQAGSTFHFTVLLGRGQHSAPCRPRATAEMLHDMETIAKGYDARPAGIDKSALICQVGGAPVLLVEDNPINQRVAREMLESVGLVVTVASHGQEAIHLLSHGSFELVFMDVQMPVMDGCQATRQLRTMDAFAHVPVIAMTAHALVGDRENCLAAGMNDYIAKPIDLQQLFRVLARWIQPRQNPVHVGALLARAAEREDAPVGWGDLPGIQVQSALAATGTTVGFYKQMWCDFVRDHAQAVEVIRTSLYADDPDAARLLAHSIKGIAGTLGAKSLQTAAYRLEQLTVGHQREAWPEALDLFAQAMEEVLHSVSLWEQEPATPAADPSAQPGLSPQDPQAVLQQVATMERYLRRGSVEAMASLAPLRQLLAGTFLHQELTKLERDVDRFAFDEACQHLAAIAARLRPSQGESTP